MAQELRLHIGDRRLPRAVLPLVLSGFGPILVAQYRAGGEEHPGWRATLELLDRVLAGLDAAAAHTPGHLEAEAVLIMEVSQALTAAGFEPARVEQLTDPLAGTFDELAAAAPADDAAPGAAKDAAPARVPDGPSAAEQQRAVQSLLRGGDWFRVWCASSSNCRWLKLDKYYAGADTVVFEDFGGENRLKVRATAFLHDLAAGRSAPVDPDPTLQRLLKALPPAPAERLDAGEVWFKAAAPATAAA